MTVMRDATPVSAAVSDTLAPTTTDVRWSAATTIVFRLCFALSFARPMPERLIIDGPMNGRTVHLELKLRDPNSFLLQSRGFKWVQEVPFNR